MNNFTVGPTVVVYELYNYLDVVTGVAELDQEYVDFCYCASVTIDEAEETVVRTVGVLPLKPIDHSFLSPNSDPYRGHQQSSLYTTKVGYTEKPTTTPGSILGSGLASWARYGGHEVPRLPGRYWWLG